MGYSLVKFKASFYLITIFTSNPMFQRAIWDKLPEYIFKILKLPEKNEGNYKIFKIHDGDLSTKYPEPKMRLLVNHTKPANSSS